MDIWDHLSPLNIRDSFANILIYKDECMRCFGNPEDETGINVWLRCLQGFCSDLNHSKHHYEQSNHPLAVNIRKVLKPDTEGSNKITKLAIGKEGGADIEDKFDTIASLICLACDKVLDKPDAFIASAVDSVVQARSAFFESQVGEWELEIKECVHTTNLDQSESHQIAEKTMAHCGDWDLKSNLWLCMICGNLGCGRQQYGGVAGNSHGVAHFESTGHPVVCKLGTITAHGTASLYCYTCNDDVDDKKLKEHLQALGIDMGLQIKTEKTMTEINLEKNLTLTLSKIVEEGRTLTPQFGPGYTGMVNLGNSCYLNSVVQVLFSYPKIMAHYSSMYLEHHKYCEKFPAECFDWQISKVAFGLISGRYSQKKEWLKPQHDLQSEEEKTEIDIYQDGIRPQMFKNFIGKGHEEFQTGRQQDAQEYLQHLMDKIEKEEKARGRQNPCQMFDFDIEHRYECNNCHCVAYVPERTNQINLHIVTLENDVMLPEVEEMKNWLERFLGDEIINKECPSCNNKQDFVKRTRFLNLPETLIVVTQRFTFQNWTPTKVSTSLNMILEDLNFEEFKVPGGIQPGEVALPSGGEVEVEVEPNIDPALLNQCLMMGLPEQASKHALYHTGNQSADDAVTWYFSNMENPDINGPLPKQKIKVKQGDFGTEKKKEEVSESVQVNEEMLMMMASMGMDENRSRKALIKFENNFDTALDYLMSHSPEEDQFDEGNAAPVEAYKHEVDTRPGVYDLGSFISHLGTSIHSGHYVAHIKKEGDWVLYNDHKVAKTSDPPIDKAFIYFYNKK